MVARWPLNGRLGNLWLAVVLIREGLESTFKDNVLQARILFSNNYSVLNIDEQVKAMNSSLETENMPAETTQVTHLEFILSYSGSKSLINADEFS